ncbi:MAG: PAS-domain containing protein [Alphaproteobacteria bacterium]
MSKFAQHRAGSTVLSAVGAVAGAAWPAPAFAAVGDAGAAWPIAAAAWGLAILLGYLLLRAARRLRALGPVADAAPDGYWRWGADPADQGAPSPRLVAAFGLADASGAHFEHVLEALAEPDRARLADAVRALRSERTGFALELAPAGADDRSIMARGAPRAGGGAVLWLIDARAIAAPRAALRAERDGLSETLESLAFPVWRRRDDLTIAWCNRAYAEAVEAPDAASAARRGAELVKEAAGRPLAEQALATGERASGDASVVFGGQRRTVNLVETPLADGSGTVGSAQDVTEAERARRDLERHLLAHREVMANLKTPIAVLDHDKRLEFFNESFAATWRLDPSWLGSEPTYGEILDAMRERRLLPEMADFRAYKRELLESFETATETVEDVLYRPDGSTIRIAMTPHPLGGMVFTYEDVTDRLALERSLNTQIAVQRATLDNLFEAVAVFGSDGRLKLSNPGFARLWRLDEAALGVDTHIADVLEWTKVLHDYGPDWEAYKANVIGQISERSPVSTRLDRRDGTVLEVASVPLPDGATLMTYLDVTDGIQKERALTERTEALETADRLKSEFIANISYELRTPLNTIAGFAEILANQYFGALTERQAEYCRGILDATHQLTNTINDILDLASIEAGQMTLRLERFDLARAIAGMQGLLQRRAALERLAFTCSCPSEVGDIVADQRRIKQIVFNLMSNAFKFTPPGGRVALDIAREADDVVITVADTGVGIHADERPRVFDRFQRGRAASRRPGTGIGLSLVKSFVELHGGSVTLESHPDAGTRIVCRLPAEPRTVEAPEHHAA